MQFRSSKLLAGITVGLVLSFAPAAFAQTPKITPPVYGQYTVGDDYFLANYTQLLDYWNKVVKETDRMHLVRIGTTAEGRPMMMAVITSAANYKNLARYKEISQKLARAEGLNDKDARALATEGKAVVWIDGGLHATECINSQALFTETYELLTRTDAETMRILSDDILLLVPINPDGMELVSNWYMRESDPKKRSTGNIPRLYQKYIGHDDNRDSFISNQPETDAVNRQMFVEWIPQIMYNQHQTGPAGSVLFFSPFRDPFSYNQDPLVPIGIDLVSAAVHERFLAEGKPGAVMRSNAPYSTWFNGGDRTTTGFHNQIGLLSEIIGNPTPMSIPLVASKLLPRADQPAPIGPKQEWHQRQSIDYVLTADYAILDIASRLREEFLFRIYRAGKNSIDRGSEDFWTLTPKKVAAMEDAYAKDQAAAGITVRRGPDAPAGDTGGGGNFNAGMPVKYWDQLHTKEARDPRGYIIPSDQGDFLTATKFVNALIKCGIEVQRASRDFEVEGKKYPSGSYVIQAAQAFRPHLRDMLEPQDHPNDFEYPGGPPRPPYDIAGYTLAYQMGVQFDSILDGFTGPFVRIPDVIPTPAGKVIPATSAAGYLLSHKVNDSYTGTNRLLAGGEDVYWLKTEFAVNGKTWPAGTIYIPAKASTRALVTKIAAENGLTFEATSAKPHGEAIKLRPVRVGLWDRYGGNQDSGLIRWMFDKAFPTTYEVVYPPMLDAGNLKSKYDILIFPSGALPNADASAGGGGRRGGGGGGGGRGGAPGGAAGGGGRGGGARGGGGRGEIPDEFKNEMGNVTLATTGPQLKKFVEEGGTILAIGTSSLFGPYLGIPVTSALTEKSADGKDVRLPTMKFYVPGSVLQASVDNTVPISYGMPDKADVFYDNSPAFKLTPGADLKNTHTIMSFNTPHPLRSGWAWGEEHLEGAVEAVDEKVGEGHVYLFGPEITFRGQPHGTFKFLFNAIDLAGSTTAQLPE
jgi:hypothetical protein